MIPGPSHLEKCVRTLHSLAFSQTSQLAFAAPSSNRDSSDSFSCPALSTAGRRVRQTRDQGRSADLGTAFSAGLPTCRRLRGCVSRMSRGVLFRSSGISVCPDRCVAASTRFMRVAQPPDTAANPFPPRNPPLACRPKWIQSNRSRQQARADPREALAGENAKWQRTSSPGADRPDMPCPASALRKPCARRGTRQSLSARVRRLRNGFAPTTGFRFTP